MDRKTIAIDLAKDVFELAIDGGGAVERQRLTRKKFQQFAAHLPPSRIVMEACGSANHWARWFIARGHEVIFPTHNGHPIMQPCAARTAQGSGGRSSSADDNDCSSGFRSLARHQHTLAKRPL